MNTFKLTDHGIEPNSEQLQTKAIQTVFDLCRSEGGTVVVPRGKYRVSSLRMWSNMTLKLESGAYLIGSDDCDDYEVFDIPDGMDMHSDMEVIVEYYKNRPWQEYRRAIISVYGGKNIAIIGEPDSHIDGSDCFDPNGEEGYRGPHGIYITNVDGLTLSGYTIENCGNFEHQIDTCKNITVKNVTCLGGSDGFHLHVCDNTLIEDCVFHTGDDCIGGINMNNLTVRHCEFNTSCDVFRAGGKHILVEDCHIFGPGIYPHGMTVVQNLGTVAVKDKSNRLPREEGRHNLLCVWLHFASETQPDHSAYEDITFRNCTVDNADRFMVYHADSGSIQTGAHLIDMTLENIKITGLLDESYVYPSVEEPLNIKMKNITAEFRDGSQKKIFCDNVPGLNVKEF